MFSLRTVRSLPHYSLRIVRPGVFAAPQSKRLFTSNRILFNDTIKFAPNDKKRQIEVTDESKTVNINAEKPTSIGKIPQKYMISFTCKKCDTRSTHVISKQAYAKGTILIECPGCKSRHLIADHLKIFSDNRITVEDILKAKGESVSHGDTNDIEFDKLPESIKKKLGISSDSPEHNRN